MADATTSSPPETSTSNGTGTKKKGGLLTFIKKNKTLSAVVGGIGGYLLYKMSKEKNEGGTTEPEGEVNQVAGEGGALAGDQAAAEFELGRSERIAEGSRQEVEEIEAEREEERAKRKEKEREGEEEEKPGGGEPGEPTVPGTGGGTGGGETEPAPGGAPSVSIHGRNFPGATGSHIAKSGQTEGGKKYVEYAIQFPGKVEHWQHFTATGNWRQVAGSDTGGGANAPGPGNNPKPTQPPAGGPATSPGGKKKPPKVGIGPAKPVAGPQPKPAPQPAPPRAPTCDPGTVGNILHARGEVNRLQGEINNLQNSKPKGWAANVASKQATRDQFQQVIANGHAQPGCAAV